MSTNLTPKQLPLFIHCREIDHVIWQMPFEGLLENRNQIHVWVTDLRNYSPRQMAANLGLLSRTELNRMKRFKYEHDRKRYLVAKATLRKLLSKYLSVAPEDLSFSRNAYHKPFLHPNPEGTQFNLSHAGDKVIIAFRFASRNTGVGIDMEKIDTQYDYKAMIQRYFTPEERSTIKYRDCRHLFFKYWTRKEALLKAVGTGLTDEMSEINVAFDTNVCEVKHLHFFRMTHRPYFISSFKIEHKYIASLAIEGLPVKPLYVDYDYFL